MSVNQIYLSPRPEPSADRFLLVADLADGERKEGGGDTTQW
jgi:hypothetical protein